MDNASAVKATIARPANLLLARSGQPFFQAESYGF
jgi:hypothetical protein